MEADGGEKDAGLWAGLGEHSRAKWLGARALDSHPSSTAADRHFTILTEEETKTERGQVIVQGHAAALGGCMS